MRCTSPIAVTAIDPRIVIGSLIIKHKLNLNCLGRNARSIDMMLDLLKENPLPHKMMRDFWVVRTVNLQQREMYDNRTHTCKDRITSISQPYVRPIVRGKAGKKAGFGTKIDPAHANGFAKAETLSWDAYNESADLVVITVRFVPPISVGLCQ